MSGNRQGTNGVLLAVAMAAAAAILAVLPFLKGAFFIGKHEGDTLHLADIVLRMGEAGQVPHLDFMTPIGIGAVWPMAAFVQAGLGLGHAIFAAQAAVAALLFLPVLRVALSRFSGLLSWAFGLYLMILCLALVHGESEASISISMHYNRWAWALAYLAIPLAMLAPNGAPRPWLDGGLIGLAMAGLVLIKVTYFVAFAPPVLIALIARRQGRMILAALVAGLGVAGAVTGLLGAEFWLAYLHDLQSVAGSETRPAPGHPLGAVMAAPAYLAGTLTLVAVIIFLRQAGRMTEGMVLLFLMPGFIYVTWQNFGNDPQWLVLLALLAFSLRPSGPETNGFGWSLSDALRVTGIVAVTLGAGSILNLMWSPFRHMSMGAEKAVPLLSALPAHHDIMVQEPRVYRVSYRVAADGPGTAYAAYKERADWPDPTTLNGEALPDCELAAGYNAWFETVVKDLEDNGQAGSAVLVADLFSALWLYGDLRPVRGGAPWYYGGTPGIAGADHLLVPLCPTGLNVRTGIVKALEEDGWILEEERRTDTYILLRPVAP